MPPPIVPAPTIATLAIGRAAVCGGSPAILPDARSAKKRWMSAFACSVSTHSKNSARSRSQPSSNGSDAAASIASTAFSGATWWRRVFAASCRADANSAAFSSADPRFSERSRVLRTRVVTPVTPTLRAKRTAPSTRSPSTTRSIRPAACASRALSGLPVTHISRAFWTPTRRGSRCVPSAPGMIPRLTSGWPMSASGTAMRKWPAMAISRPPPSAVP